MSNNGIIEAFKAEALLGDADIMERIAKLKSGLQYSNENERVSFDSYIATLRGAVDDIPKLELDTDVPPGTENQYSIQLVTTMEQIVDMSDRVLRKMAHFQGRLRDAERQINNMRAEFVAWYLLAASPLLKNLDNIKLPQRELRSLADAEFSRLMGNLDVRIACLFDDLKIEFDRVASHKAAQKEKHSLGKDQANASWTSTLPSFGGAVSSEPSTLTRPQDFEEDLDEDVPAFIGHKPKVSDVQDRLNKAKPGDTVVIRNGERVVIDVKDEIRGTFKKTVTASAEAVRDEDGKPVVVEAPAPTSRKRLIFDDEDEVL